MKRFGQMSEQKSLRSVFQAFVADESGQAATEYIMVISVMTLALIGATHAFYDPRGPFLRAFRQFGRNVGSIVADSNSPILPGFSPGR